MTDTMIYDDRVMTMTDLETWGTSPGHAIRSIGACRFDKRGTIIDEFYVNIADRSSMFWGLTKDRQTEDWWLRQSAEAQAVFAENPMTLPDALDAFAEWYKPGLIWCRGASFDFPILSYAYRRVGSVQPWKYHHELCQRTALRLMDFDTNTIADIGIPHHALSDCKYQVACLAASGALRRL